MRNNQRKSPRFTAKPGTYIAYLEGAGTVRDLGPDGLFVLDAEPLPIGTEISFSIRHGTYDIPLKGVVRRSEEEKGMAIEFVDVSPAARRQLQAYFAALMR